MARKLKLTKGYVAFLDAEDYARAAKFRWWALVSPRGPVYAISRMPEYGKSLISMHRWLLDLPPGDPRQGGHVNGNALDNRRQNLRVCWKVQSRTRHRHPTVNCPYKGVSPNHGKWQATIRHRGKQIYLGNFATPEEAGRAYNKAASKYFGEFARLNQVSGSAH
jgi:hypothetical protein